jgi:hypothetical protein
MIVRRVAPLSFAKVSGILYALMGFVGGGIISVIAIVGGALSPDASSGFFGMAFGAAAVVILPIFYGCLGFVFALIGAALYNVIASMVGGLELDLQ